MKKGAKPSKSSKAVKNNNKEKVYVVDTNVIIHDPNILKKLKGRVFVPTTVLSELDKHKGGHSEKARNIREFARFIEKNPKKMWLHNSSTYPGTCDEQIITSAIKIGQSGFDVTLITNDILMGVIARGWGVNLERHELIESSIDMPYKGVLSAQEAENDKAKLRKDKELNKYLALHDGIYRHTNDGLKKLPKDFQVWGIGHKNLEQRCSLDALLDPKIKLVTLTGRAGTGKTLMAILGGLQAVLEEQSHKRLLVARPAIPMGQDLGYLPGNMEEKLAPWMQPIIDNIEFVFDSSSGGRGKSAWQDMLGNGILKMESLAHIRGRSIPNEYIIIDEAQNLTRHEVKTIISRAGENTKIILTGDLQQIDNPKVDSISNGLAYVIDKFKDQEIAAHIHFSKCERSELAELASELL